ncbi:MAG: hypothetical protein PHY43_08425 [Verrucomicrobiales bacterium]|nr:hypothetical protein [Verrucomicrobiales bacterium]
MFLATTNKARRLLHLSYIDKVTVAELERGYPEVVALLAEFPDGFEMLADLGRLESMDIACEGIIGKTMEMLEQRGLERVVRVISDPSKDIGLKIIGLFHYSKKIRIVTCATMTEAARVLEL